MPFIFIKQIEEGEFTAETFAKWFFAEDLIPSKITGCVVIKCPTCERQVCWYEGVVSYIFERIINVPCRCGQTYPRLIGDGR